MYNYDAIVIGAGHNGLVAAAILANRGLKVAVFEKNHFIGGMAASPEIWKGFKVPIGAYVISLFRREIARELKLFELGLKIIPKNPNMVNILENRRYLRIWSSTEKTVKEIEKFSKIDAERYFEWSKFWSGLSILLDKLYLRHPESIVDLVERLIRKLKAFKIDTDRINRFINDMLWIINAPALKVLNEYFESDEVKASLIEDALIGEMVSPNTPGTALLMAHHYIGNIAGERGAWGYVLGGMGRLSEILADICRKNGVEIYTGYNVEEIIVKNNEAIGIKVKGKIIRSRYIISNLNIKNTFTNLISDSSPIDDEIIRKINSLRSIGAASKIVLALENLPKTQQYLADISQNIYSSSTLYIPSIEYVEKAYGEAITFGESRSPWFSINTPSYLDTSITPENKHLISIFLQYTPYSRDRWSSERRIDLLNRVIDIINDNIFINIKETIIRSEIITPKDIEKMFNTKGGNIFHISISPDQVFFNRPLPQLSNFTTPIRNLYICGSSMHPGGGVSGAPGYLAAYRVLGKKLRLSNRDLIEIATKIVSRIR